MYNQAYMVHANTIVGKEPIYSIICQSIYKNISDKNTSCLIVQDMF